MQIKQRNAREKSQIKLKFALNPASRQIFSRTLKYSYTQRAVASKEKSAKCLMRKQLWPNSCRIRLILSTVEVQLDLSLLPGMAKAPSWVSWAGRFFLRRARHRNTQPRLPRFAAAAARWRYEKFCSSFARTPSASSIRIRCRQAPLASSHFLFDSLTRLAMTIDNRRSNHFLSKEEKSKIELGIE